MLDNVEPRHWNLISEFNSNSQINLIKQLDKYSIKLLVNLILIIE